MEKKLILLAFVLLIPFISAIPQFLIFQGDVKIDGRIAPQGTFIIFSIKEAELNHFLITNPGKYGPMFIQGYSQYYGKEISITINGYKDEQKISYVYPQDINLNLSTLTEKALKIIDFSPKNEIIDYKIKNQTFNVSTQTGYSDPVKHTWFLDGKKVLEVAGTDFSSYVYERLVNDTLAHLISVTANDDYLSVSKTWTLSGETKISLENLKHIGYRQIGYFCESDWECTAWSSCNEGIRTRRCYDTTSCIDKLNKPIEISGCDDKEDLNQKEESFGFGVPLTLFTLVLLTTFLILIYSIKTPR